MSPTLQTYSRLVLIALLILTGCSSVNDQPAPQSTVSGTVLTSDSSAVPDAVVEAITNAGSISSTDTTDVNGRFSFQQLSNESLISQIRVTHAEYGTFSQSVSSQGGDVSITLSHHDSCCGVIAVSAMSNGDALNDYTVTVHRDGHRIAHRSVHHGSTSIHHLCEGEYVVAVSKEGFHSSLDTVSLAECDSVLSEISLEPIVTNPHDSCCSNSAVITVVDSSSDASIAGAVIHVMKDGHQMQAVPTNHNGQATINHLCEGTYQLLVSSSGFATKTSEITIGCDEDASLEVALVSIHHDKCCSGSIALRVFHAGHSHMNIESATVTLTQGHETIATTMTGTNGIASFDSLCEDTAYTLTVSIHGYHTETIHFTPHDCQPTSHSVGLRPQ